MNKIFLDTNLLIYLAATNTSKAEKVSQLISSSDLSLISVQVLNEFAAACFKKELLKSDQIRKYIEEYRLLFDVADVSFTNISLCFDIKEKYKYSWYDSLIIATSLLNDCSILYTEDLRHSQVITLKNIPKENNLTTINPFI